MWTMSKKAGIFVPRALKTIYRNKALNINALNQYSFQICFFFIPANSIIYSALWSERCIFKYIVNIATTSIRI